MCGIVACRSSRPALNFLLPALAQLEYRGYDSAGIAVASEAGEPVRLRSVGRLAKLAELVADYDGPTLDGVGIGHTRWATHGPATENNAHPHVDCTGEVFVVHNGIIENAGPLRAALLAAGHRFSSDVDSEVVAHLVEDEIASGAASTAEAVQGALPKLTGSWALAVLRRGERAVVVTTRHSPLLVAETPEGAFAASDVTAMAAIAERVEPLEDGDIVELTDGGLRWVTARTSPDHQRKCLTGLSPTMLELAEAPDFMAKEIAEQPAIAADLVARYVGQVPNGRLWTGLGLPPLSRVRFLACGTSLHAAQVLARVLASAGVPSTLAPASEVDGLVTEPNTLTVALSQSGETADVLRVLDRRYGPVLALTNSRLSTLARTADAVVDLTAGVEVGVAATKTFTAQVIAGTAVMLSGLVAAGLLTSRDAAGLADELAELPSELALAHELAQGPAAKLAEDLIDRRGFLFVARGSAVPYAAEGALKLKEISYCWAEHHAAGELKHGPIALIEPGTPVVVVDNGHPKLAGNVAEIAARGARVISVAGLEAALPYRVGSSVDAPWGPLSAVVPLQHLARELAVALGRDVDKPRNLAKSVTVE
jgi:glucosamine--fructose-6-phosphate aminotransferase (isomerizing)